VFQRERETEKAVKIKESIQIIMKQSRRRKVIAIDFKQVEGGTNRSNVVVVGFQRR
jgi:hypothetical protein